MINASANTFRQLHVQAVAAAIIKQCSMAVIRAQVLACMNLEGQHRIAAIRIC
jgi:hypothetical protein